MTSSYSSEDNYYRRSVVRHSPQPSLDGGAAAEVCVVGGGLAGLTAALTMARSGAQVVLLESATIAWGASGRNGGFVSPGYSTGFANIARRVGESSANELHRLSIEGMRIVRQNIDTLSMRGVDPVHGILHTARTDNSTAQRRTRDWLQQKFDYPVQFVARKELRDQVKSDKYFHALLDENAFHFHPVNYALGLVAELQRLGAVIHEQTQACKIHRVGTNFNVKTAHGTVVAESVLVACGGYTDALVPKLRRSYIPITTFVLLTEPTGPRLADAIRTTAAIGDSRRASDYYRVVENGTRLLWGGMISTRRDMPAHIGDRLVRRIVDTYPQLAGIGVDCVWAGKMAYARHLMPQIGELEPGLWYCTGFGGHGMNTTAIGGTVVAEAILGHSDRYKMFAPFGLVWNGNVIGRAAVQATYWSYQLMDFLKERASSSRK